MYSRNISIKILLIWLYGISAHAYTLQTVRAEGIPGEIDSEERRELRKLFRGSKEKETEPQETDVGSQQILLTRIKLVMNKAEEIMAIAQSNGLLNEHPMDTTDPDSIFPEIQTKEYKVTGPIEHGNPISDDFKLSFGDGNVEEKKLEKEFGLASTLPENHSPSVQKQSEEVLQSSFEHKTKLPSDLQKEASSTDEDSQSYQQKFNKTTITATAGNQIFQESQQNENLSPPDSVATAELDDLTEHGNPVAPATLSPSSSVVIPISEPLNLEGLPITISVATPEPLQIETVPLPLNNVQDESLETMFPALFPKSSDDPARSVVIETSGPLIRAIPQQRIFRAPDPMKRGDDPSIIRLVVLPTRGDLPTTAQQDGRAINQFVLVNPEEPERPENPNVDGDGKSLNAVTEFSVGEPATQNPQQYDSSTTASADPNGDGISIASVTRSNDLNVEELDSTRTASTEETPERSNEFGPVTESLEDALSRYDIDHGYVNPENDKPLAHPIAEIRNSIVPMSSPYVIVSQPIAVSSKKKPRVVVPTFLFNFRKPVPVYMSFGKLNTGVEHGSGDDPRLTKEQFFKNPDSALANFKKDYLQHSKGDPTHVLNQMRIDASNPARQFPLRVFTSLTGKNEKANSKSPSIFDFIKSLQTRASRQPVLYMGP